MATSFLFIVNELCTNDDPETGNVFPNQVDQRWRPPVVAEGFYQPEAGDVYRWHNGTVSLAPEFVWTPEHKTIWGYDAYESVVYPDVYREATVFFCNRFDKFFTARGDATAYNINEMGPEDDWHPLAFRHYQGNALADHVGEEQYVTARKASWISQVIPSSYRAEYETASGGGLSGLLPIVISLIAFSTTANRGNLRDILLTQRAWRNRQWKGHSRDHGRREKRGMVVRVYYDPTNPHGSTQDSLLNLESNPIFLRN